MSFATLYVGDSIITLTTNQSLDPNDPLPFHYTLHFRDVPTGRVAELSFTGECDALYSLAAWIVADEAEGTIGLLEAHRTRLQAELPGGPNGFLP